MAKKGKGYLSKEGSEKAAELDANLNFAESLTLASTGAARNRMGSSYYRSGLPRKNNSTADLPVVEETVRVTRVQTGYDLSKRIYFYDGGDISIKGKNKLYITIDDSNHATYYYNKKGGSGAELQWYPSK